MQNVERFINAYNAAHAIRYLLNLDLNALNERTIKIGIANIVDIEQTKKLVTTILFTSNISSPKSESLVKQTIDLTRVLNDDAKQELVEFLVHQTY